MDKIMWLTDDQMADGLQLIKAARKLLADEKRWTKDCYARDAQGRECRPTDKRAKCWCILGALWHCETRVKGKPFAYSAAIALIEQELLKRGYIEIPAFNDKENTTHEDVIKLLDDVIRRFARERGFN